MGEITTMPIKFLKSLKSNNMLALLCSICVGVLLSIFPHVLQWFQSGSFVWFADNDELGLYLPVASQAYFNHPLYFTDPVFAQPQNTIFPWLQLFPGEIIAWLFSLGPLSIGLIWRIFSGITITTGWYFIFRHYSKKPWLSFMLSVFLFSDAGLLMSKLFFSQALMFIKLISPQNLLSLGAANAHHSQLRIITPGLSLWAVLLYILMLARSRENPNWKRIFCSGISFGILFHSYFYFWTAAGLGLLVAIILDCKYWRVYLHTGWIGLLIGLPKLVTDFIFKSSTSSDWLQCSDKFLHIPRFSELIFPKIGPLLLLFALYFVWKYRKDLRFLWAHAAAGLLLLNHQIVTGLMIENFHWSYFWGPVLSLLVVLLLLGEFLKQLPKLSRLVLVSVELLWVFHFLYELMKDSVPKSPYG